MVEICGSVDFLLMNRSVINLLRRKKKVFIIAVTDIKKMVFDSNALKKKSISKILQDIYIIPLDLTLRKDSIMLHEHIKKICKEKNITGYQLSKMTGISNSLLYKILREDTADPQVSTLIKIADALDVSLDKLVGRNRK